MAVLPFRKARRKGPTCRGELLSLIERDRIVFAIQFARRASGLLCEVDAQDVEHLVRTGTARRDGDRCIVTGTTIEGERATCIIVLKGRRGTVVEFVV
mgnify:CR=1 FL=1